MAVSMMKKQGNGSWQTVKSKTDDKKKRQDDKKKVEVATDRLGKSVPAPAQKNVFADLDAAWAKNSAQSQSTTKMESTPYNGAFTGLAVEQVHLDEPESPVTPPNSDRQPGTATGNSKQDSSEPKIKKPKKTKPSVSQVAQGIELAALEASLREWERKYEGNHVSQLEMLGDFFLKTFKECELPFNNILAEKPLLKATEVPLAEVPSGLAQAVQRFLQHKEEGSLKTLILMLLSATFEGVPDSHKSTRTGAPPPKAKVGLLVLLALTIRTRPETLLAAASDMLVLGRLLTAPGRVPQLLWVVNQAASVNAAVGVAVWCRLILPQLVSSELTAKVESKVVPMDTPTHAPVLDYLETQLSRPVESDVQTSSGLVATVPGLAVETISLACFPDANPGSAPAQTRGRLQSLFLQLQAIAASSHSTPQFSEWLPVALETAATATGGFEGPGEEVVARATASVVACLAGSPDCHQLYLQKHKGHIKGSARVLQRLAASPGLLKPIRASKEATESLSSLLKQLPARHKFYLHQGRGKGWQGAAARAAESAILVLQRRSSAAGGSSFSPLAALLLLSAAGTGLLYAAHHRQELVAKAGQYLSPEQAASVLQLLEVVDSTALNALEAARPVVQPHLEAALPHLLAMQQHAAGLLQQASSSQLGQQAQPYVHAAVAKVQMLLSMVTKE